MRHQSSLAAAFLLEVCMGMGLTGIPLIPWDCHGNGNHCDSIMGMGMGIKAWEWKLNNGNVNGFPLYLFSIKSTLSSCMYANVQQFWLDKSMLPKLYAVARKVLCVPAPSAASERLFSTAGRLLEKRRTSLARSSVNSLLFLHSNMQWELKLILMFDWLRILNSVSFGWIMSHDTV